MAASTTKSQRLSAARVGALGGVSSMLRLAARERQASASATPAWLAGLTRALRSAGPGQGPRPLHAVLAGGEFGPSEWHTAR